MITLYENIRKFREACGMSQDTLAKLTGYTDRSSIAKIEKGQVDLQQSKIVLFAKALDVPVCTLVGWEDDSFAVTTAEADLIRKYRRLGEVERALVVERIDTLFEREKSRMEGDVNAG